MKSQRDIHLHRLKATATGGDEVNVSKPVAEACAWAVAEIERLEAILQQKAE